ncbi:hypothetical protein [Aquisediminimonas profunda]|uniref:hypothetical protein n=1 Tax=Aquisediminimonas profunda TaxID=1550733 RepID=UPI001C626359|nr:hypothetical protein [Aquisediminimonas profunda]
MEYDVRAGALGQQKARSFRSLLILFIIAFLAGIAAMGWGLSRWEAARLWLFGTPVERKAPGLASLPGSRTLPLPAPTVSTPDLTARMAEVEARMARIEAAGTAASSGSSARAEALLVSFAARRAIDRGIGLGYVEGLLTQRFGGTQPRAVASIIAAARQPVTLEQLQSGLAAVAPALTDSGPDEDWWTEFKHGLGSVFVVRQAGTAPADPQSRIERASQMIEEGRVDLALAEVARLPNRDKAAQWMTMARRYVESHRALDLLEAAAITSEQRPQPALPVEPAKPSPAPAETL